MSEPLDHSGVKLDIEALLRLRHVVRSWPRKDSPANSLPGGLVHKRRGRGLEAAEIRHFVDGDDVVRQCYGVRAGRFALLLRRRRSR